MNVISEVTEVIFSTDIVLSVPDTWYIVIF